MKPEAGVSHLARNNERPLFKSEVPCAVDFAIDRKAVLDQVVAPSA